ncbi:hypothetical protein KUV28_17670 [Ferrimonas balearica]|nr:hypothetical protein [Ferrimonas balearica]
MARIRIDPTFSVTRAVVDDPVVAKISSIVLAPTPVPLSALKVPISPTADPDGTEIFTAPKGAIRYYLPVYALRETRVEGTARYDLAFVHDQAGDRWGLEMTLAKRAPATIGASAAAKMKELRHELKIGLTYLSGGSGGTRRELLATDITQSRETCHATIWTTSLAERDSLYQALTRPESEPRLTVSRAISVAVSTDASDGPVTEDTGLLVAQRRKATLRPATRIDASALQRKARLDTKVLKPELTAKFELFGTRMPKPEVELVETRNVRLGSSDMVEAHFRIKNLDAFGRSFFTPKLDRNGTVIKSNARLQVEVTDADTGKLFLRDGVRGQSDSEARRFLRFKQGAKDTPKRVVFTFTDTKLGKSVRSPAIRIRRVSPPEKTFTLVDVSLPQAVAPELFTFAADQHAYIYAALDQAPPMQVEGGLARHRVSFDGKVHAYFQDAVTPTTIYFLPDEFLMARHDGTFRPPLATVRVSTNDGETGDSEVTLDYVITPHTSLDRLSDAAEQIGEDTGIAPSEMEFQPYLTDALTYTLSRPGSTGRVVEDRPTSPLMLQSPMVDTLVLPVADFQIAFDAMVGTTASAISGEIAFAIDGWGEEKRQVTLRFDHLAGAALDVEDAGQDLGDNAAMLRLTNAIESNLRLEDIAVLASRDGMITTVQGLEVLTGQVLLTPGEMEPIPVTFPDLPGTGPCSFEMLRSGVPEPDAEAIMNAILDRAALEYYREIQVRTVPSLFPDPADSPAGDAIFAIIVQFESGQAVVLEAGATEQSVRLDFSFADVVLGNRADDGTYRYSKTIVRFDGSQETDGALIESSTRVLFVTPVVVPAPSGGT